MNTDLVTVDIGGTHARFAVARIAASGAITLGEPVTLRTRDHARFEDAWAQFRAGHGRPLPPRAALAVAGPVSGGAGPDRPVRFTNNPWVFRPADLETRLGVRAWTIVNDFAAVAHAVARAPGDAFVPLAGPDRPLAANGTISVIGPGTGLGVAQLRRWHGGHHVTATEGGHIGFAPVDSVEDAILAHVRRRHARVSVERIVSGPGLAHILSVLAMLDGGDPPMADAEGHGFGSDAALWQRALRDGAAGTDSLAAAAVERFCRALGSAAGDIALAQGGFGGVVIAGGLGYRLRDRLPRSGFAERFRAKGRFAEQMADIPVKLIVHPQPGLYGAAAAFASEHGETA